MKSYVGKSVNPDNRIGAHLNGYGSAPGLRNAIKKYGADAFCVEILESDMPEAVLSKMEILHIRFFNSKTPNGYNLTDGGEGSSGIQVSPETCRKISEGNKGKRLSPETRRKLSEAQKGRPSPNKGIKHSLETRRKISETQKGRPGKSPSPETRRKMSEAQKGRPSPNKGI